MELFKLFGSIFIKDNEAGKKLDDIDKKAGNLGDKLGKLGKGVGDAGKKMSMWVTGPLVGAGAGLLGMATKAGNASDRLLDLSSITGMSTDAIQQYQHVAKTAGVSTEAITHAAEGLIRKLPTLTEGNSAAAETFKEMGIDINDTSDNIMDNMLTALASIEDPIERNTKGSQMFGGAWKDLAPILDLGADGIGHLKEEAESMGLVMSNESLNSANDFRIGMEKLKAQFSAAFMEIGTKLAPVLQDVLIPLVEDKVIPAIIKVSEKVSKWIDWFAELDGTTQTVILTIVGIVAAIGPFLLILGKVMTIVSAIIPVVVKLGGAIGLLANPIGLIVVAIGLLVGAFMYLWKTNDEFREGVIAIWEKVKDFFLKAFNFIKEKAMMVFDELKKFWDVWGETITKVFNYYLNTLLEVFKVVWNQIKTSIELVMSVIKTTLETTWKVIANAIKTVIDVIANTIKLFLSVLRGDWSSAWEAIKNITSAIFEGIMSNISIVIDGIKGIFGSFFTYVKDSFRNLWGGLKNTTRVAWEGIKNVIKKPIDWIMRQVDRVMRQVDRVKGAASAVTGAAGNVTGRVSGAVSGVGSRVRSVIPGLATGGNIERDGRVLVGESGPEFLDLPRGARVTPLDKAGETQNINNEFNIYNTFTTKEMTPTEIARKERQQLQKLGLGVAF